jgi:hypothetical protein
MITKQKVTSNVESVPRKSPELAADRQGQGYTRLTLTPSVIPNSNYVIMASYCYNGNWLKLYKKRAFLNCNHQVHRDFLSPYTMKVYDQFIFSDQIGVKTEQIVLLIALKAPKEWTGMKKRMRWVFNMARVGQQKRNEQKFQSQNIKIVSRRDTLAYWISRKWQVDVKCADAAQGKSSADTGCFW